MLGTMQLDIRVPAWARHVVSDLTDMDRAPHPVDAARVSRFRLELPDDTYFEYAFLDEEGRMRADPDNPRRAANPWYAEVSAVSGPDYRPDPLADLDRAWERGSLTRAKLDSRALGQTRRLTVYTPAGHEREALPVVLVQDGNAYWRVGGLARVLEALLERGEARPAHLVFLEPVDRFAEYAFAPEYRRFVVEEVLPHVEDAHAATGERILLGASLGGLVSLTLGLEHPERFRSVATQSGAFLGHPGDRDFHRAEGSWVRDRLAERERLPLRVYTETGTLEWLREVNREVHEVLVAKGYEHDYDERNAGHNWVNWRNGLARALRFVLEPPAAPGG